MRFSWVVVALCFLLSMAWADVAGRISGMVSDPSGAFVAGATVTLNNLGNATKQTATTNGQGQYSLPVVPIGHFDLEISIRSPGFQPYKKTGVVIDVNSALQIDATLQIKNSETVDVNDSVVSIQMSDTEIGETISSQHVAEVPLNGRSYTDLLATQAGVSPVTTSGASNSSSGGGFGTVPVAGNGNTGQFSVNGQRDSANGFFLNGASVQESIGKQAGVIPNLDSIAEFRIISSNTDAEYGGYSGGLINVVTKSGGDKFHGSVFGKQRHHASGKLLLNSIFKSRKIVCKLSQSKDNGRLYQAGGDRKKFAGHAPVGRPRHVESSYRNRWSLWSAPSHFGGSAPLDCG